MVRLVIAESMRILRKALVAVLKLEPDIEVVADFENGTEVVRRARQLRPDVALLDLNLPGMDGLATAAALHATVPDCRIVILAETRRPENLRRALATQIDGFLVKDIDTTQLGHAIRSAADGKRVIDPELALAALDLRWQPLSTRELQVLQLMSEGLATHQIAERLGISVGTVRNYLASGRTKLGARNRVDAVRIARESALL
ncbi:response regulator [Kitasatospora sp. NPDC089509]|uniref:response regulator transcription factor n=1 Tax=Kitasatospora sp. NPDC089509 TaxID=3364079 RepID=UPI003802AEB2